MRQAQKWIRMSHRLVLTFSRNCFCSRTIVPFPDVRDKLRDMCGQQSNDEIEMLRQTMDLTGIKMQHICAQYYIS